MVKYIRNRYNRTIVLWSDDSTDSVGGTAQDSWNFYNQFTIPPDPDKDGETDGGGRKGWPAITLSHEVSDAGIGAMRNGTVQLLTDAGVQLLTTAQCLDLEPYEYVGGYGVRDETWTCQGNWTLPSLPSPSSASPSPSSIPPTPSSSSEPTESTLIPTQEVSISTGYATATFTSINVSP